MYQATRSKFGARKCPPYQPVPSRSCNATFKTARKATFHCVDRRMYSVWTGFSKGSKLRVRCSASSPSYLTSSARRPHRAVCGGTRCGPPSKLLASGLSVGQPRRDPAQRGTGDCCSRTCSSATSREPRRGPQPPSSAQCQHRLVQCLCRSARMLQSPVAPPARAAIVDGTAPHLSDVLADLRFTQAPAFPRLSSCHSLSDRHLQTQKTCEGKPKGVRGKQHV